MLINKAHWVTDGDNVRLSCGENVCEGVVCNFVAVCFAEPIKECVPLSDITSVVCVGNDAFDNFCEVCGGFHND